MIERRRTQVSLVGRYGFLAERARPAYVTSHNRRKAIMSSIEHSRSKPNKSSVGARQEGFDSGADLKNVASARLNHASAIEEHDSIGVERQLHTIARVETL